MALPQTIRQKPLLSLSVAIAGLILGTGVTVIGVYGLYVLIATISHWISPTP